ncbi:MAG: hypothetical protein JSW65_03265, partial [Candidatus Bipolaricaulota bacterium]
MSRYQREEAEAQVELDALGEDDQEASYYADGSLQELERQMERDRRRMRRLEPVNMRAIEEY